MALLFSRDSSVADDSQTISIARFSVGGNQNDYENDAKKVPGVDVIQLEVTKADGDTMILHKVFLL